MAPTAAPLGKAAGIGRISPKDTAEFRTPGARAAAAALAKPAAAAKSAARLGRAGIAANPGWDALFDGSRRGAATVKGRAASTPFSFESDGVPPLNAHEALGRKDDGGLRDDAPPTPAEADEPLSPEARRGILGMFISRGFSVIAFSIGAIAYPLLVIESVGFESLFNLYALGGLISIGIGLAAGKVADRMPLKKYLLFNMGIRAALALANASFYFLGWLNFWTLLGLTVVNAWQFSTQFITDPAVMTELVGKNRFKIRSAESLIKISTILVSVFTGLYLSRWVVGALGLGNTFLILAAIPLIPMLVLWRMLPEMGRRVPEAAKARVSEAWSTVKAFPWRAWGLNLALAGAGVAAFFLWNTPLPFIAATAFALMRSKTYKETIGKHKLLKLALLFVVLTAMAEIPMRNAVLGSLAFETAGAAGKAAYLGKLVAAFYVGQLATATGLLDKGMKRLKPALKWIGAAATAFWASMFLLPHGWLPGPWGYLVATAVSVGFFLAVHHLTPKVSERAWMRWELLGLLGMSVPLFFWGVPEVLYASLFLFGMLHAPASQTLYANFSSQSYEHAKGSFSYLMGMRGSFINMATAAAYAFYGLMKTLPAHFWGASSAFPFTWYALAGLFAVIAVLFLIGSFVIPFKKKNA